MKLPLLTEVAAAIEAFAPPKLQESYDNTGWQVLCNPAGVCRGVLTCVDATPEIVTEAGRRGLNMVVSHHPVLFRGQKRLAGETLVQQTVMDAIRADISIYSCHTALDSAPGGISAEMARMLGLKSVEVLAPNPTDNRAGLGCIGSLPSPLEPKEFIGLVKSTFEIPVARCSRGREATAIERVGLCGGSGSEFIADAIAGGAQAFITSDTRHHDFVDFGREILIVDIPHWSAEACSRTLFDTILRHAFPELRVMAADADCSPILHR